MNNVLSRMPLGKTIFFIVVLMIMFTFLEIYGSKEVSNFAIGMAVLLLLAEIIFVFISGVILNMRVKKAKKAAEAKRKAFESKKAALIQKLEAEKKAAALKAVAEEEAAKKAAEKEALKQAATAKKELILQAVADKKETVKKWFSSPFARAPKKAANPEQK